MSDTNVIKTKRGSGSLYHFPLSYFDTFKAPTKKQQLDMKVKQIKALEKELKKLHNQINATTKLPAPKRAATAISRCSIIVAKSVEAAKLNMQIDLLRSQYIN
jgi:hypothetical protein